MYLVIIEKRLSSIGEQICQKIEDLQSFGYQLKSKEWSVLDVTPKKGASFELHYGSDRFGEDDEIVALFITDSKIDALKLCSNSEVYFDPSTIEKDCIKSDINFAVCLYLSSVLDADSWIDIDCITHA